MAGNRETGLKAAATNKAKYGDDFYQKIAQKTHDSWVKNGRKPRGFATMSKERLLEISRKGAGKRKLDIDQP